MKKILKFGGEIIPLSRRQHFVLFIIIALVFQFVFFAIPSLADEINAQGPDATSTENMIIKNDSLSKSASLEAGLITSTPSSTPLANIQSEVKASSTVVVIPNKTEKVEKVISTSLRKMTAYNSDVDQTDNSPCSTATGFNVCEHGVEDTIAANFLKFGTRVRIPELFGDRIFVVRDRMHPKNNQKVDVWMKSHADAMKFGVKIAKIEVLE